MTRDEFRAAVFARDGGRCVVPGCGRPAQGAHHIIERRLFPDGGYDIDNGASVCGEHHLAAEQTTLSCDDLRAACGIRRVALPLHLYPDQPYDKWGNPILPDGRRLRGELFDDESVQRVLAPVAHLFTDRVKYPRTFHLPWSPGLGKGDRVLASMDRLAGAARVVVTEKLDGENTSLYRDGLHARSLDYAPHPSRDRLRALHASVAHDIPEGWRICGENLWAQHSIAYRALPHFFCVFAVWDGLRCLPWDETVEWATLLDLPTVPVLYAGPWNEAAVRACFTGASRCGGAQEGYVARNANVLHLREFGQAVGKYVRADHVQTHAHWMHSAVVPNGVSP